MCCSKCSEEVLLTYNTLDMISDIRLRVDLGWKNHYTFGEIVILFQKFNFRLVSQIYTKEKETYYKFKKV